VVARFQNTSHYRIKRLGNTHKRNANREIKMKIAVPKELWPGENRVALSPDVTKKLVASGCHVVVETGAGNTASLPDNLFVDAGAQIATSVAALYDQADVVFKIRAPITPSDAAEINMPAELEYLPKNVAILAHVGALQSKKRCAELAAAQITTFAMELMPRITRAQSMDILSSQSNLAGYKAVIDAAACFGRAFPMMMTAAGTVPPARVLVFGAGVAGLQAIATAKRLGAVVYATDVRYAAKEQVESLGGKFIVVDEEEMKKSETSAGYAKEMSADFQKKQADAIAAELAKADIAICTALIPGRPAPQLISENMLQTMKPGAVVVDLAVETGGNCAGAVFDQVVEKHGVTIIGHGNMPARLAADASMLFAKNLYNFVVPMLDKESGTIQWNWDDELVQGTCITRDGHITQDRIRDLPDVSSIVPAGHDNAQED
jgi:NAD(P) transhydrogenase subunit alpha